MLILTRRMGEKVIISAGDSKIVVTFIGNSFYSLHGKDVISKTIRLGFEADDDTIIHREEIYNRIILNNDPITEIKHG